MQDIYPALRLVTGQYVSPTELDAMTLDDVDDLNIVLIAEARADRQRNKGR